MKSSSSIIGLFGETAPARRAPSAFVISMVLHVFAFVLLFLGLNQPRKVDLRSDNQRFTVRMMELHQPEPKPLRFTPKSVATPGQQASARAAVAGGAPEAAAAARIPLNFLTQKEATHTLIQPEVRQDILHQEATLPQVMQWKPPDPTTIKIVPPPPKPVATIDVHPSLDIPNQETRVADFKMSASPFETKAPMPAPSKTSPVNVQATQTAQQVPETASKNSGKATPASVISLSDIKLQEGTAVLPMITEVAPNPFPGSLSPGQPKGVSESGNGKTDNKQTGTSAGQTSGNKIGTAPGSQAGTAAANQTGAGGAGGQRGLGAVPGEAGLNTGGDGRSVVEITLPKNGTFGVVVVGSSLAEEYPETVDLWKGRLAYTVYLRVGTANKWILQYSLPRPKDSAGMVGRPDGPWPYDITRPSIDANVNADAIMVHGFVSPVGRFDQLAVIFPTELAETKFLLHALQQWQFRPAMQNGVPISVEVLLIIPTTEE